MQSQQCMWRHRVQGHQEAGHEHLIMGPSQPIDASQRPGTARKRCSVGWWHVVELDGAVDGSRETSAVLWSAV